MTSHAVAVTGVACDVCGGPCREPFRLSEIHDRYPFLPPEVIAMTKPDAEPSPSVDEHPSRGRRRGQDRARRLAEDRAHRPAEDR